MNTFTLSDIASFFKNEGIEYFAFCDPKKLEVINERKQKKLSGLFEPKAALFFLVPYYFGEQDSNLSLYAVSKDYHLYFDSLFKRFSQYFSLDESRFKGFSDSSPVDEVKAAAALGLGVLGDNGLLINEKYGSYVFIGEMFFSFVPEGVIPEREDKTKHCLHCSLCKSSCPSGALTNGDKNKCLSCLSQKKKLSVEEEELLKKNGVIWGCDICQKKCPLNSKAQTTPVLFFHEDRIGLIDIETVNNLLREDLFAQRAYSWRGKDVILRNLNLTL
jgi:epoxyqueuosine reductase QueG